jgi:hypothetical protein
LGGARRPRLGIPLGKRLKIITQQIRNDYKDEGAKADVPGETFTVSVAMGFLVCLIMIPVSYLVLSAALWIFVVGAIAFFLTGVLSPRISEEQPLRYMEELPPRNEASGGAEERRPASAFSKYYR